MAPLIGYKMHPALIVAMTIFMEGAGESYTGKEAIATVIYNRSIENNTSVENVCMENDQFSCWHSPKKINKFGSKEWSDSMKLAKLLTINNFVTKHKWNHYYNPELAAPGWGTKLKHRRKIGRHIFGTL